MLSACLRTEWVHRLPRISADRSARRFVKPDIQIGERPPELAYRTVPGLWEDGLVLCLKRSTIANLFEQAPRYTLLPHLPRMAAYRPDVCVATARNGPPLAWYGVAAVSEAIRCTMQHLPTELRLSVSLGQDSELAEDAAHRLDTGLAVYFCDPRSP
jgi:IS30 family transposase